MKVVVYNIKPAEKEFLALANGKTHNLTMIGNSLTEKTLEFAKGKDVVVISKYDNLCADLLMKLYNFGIKKIITRSLSMNHIDLQVADCLNMHIVNIPLADQTDQGIAEQTIKNISFWKK
ncbi:lactate dehydrogenase [Sphingobacteriaceae bacterium WQ 2009]|uniref:Lactate dehydrogenase n=1 Tax=Rhinopithecimicrobium faecis TaxID=2820698 RepID=A0A8T4HDD2_9SPHI|nr:lactate dehydrogenase [Sphingobacteriaceae bacterium WQ 2009]